MNPPPDLTPATPTYFDVRVLRQDRPGEPSYWQTFRLEYAAGLNVTSVLQHIAAHPQTASGSEVSPVAYDSNCLEEVCGACTMNINGHVRQACSALVDQLLKDQPGEIELRPMTKFPVIRDLVVDRARLFRALEKLQCWIPVDGYYDAGPGPRQSQEQQQQAYPLSECISCGCCLEACPQYSRIELEQQTGETDEQFKARQRVAFDGAFIGAHAMNQVVLMNSNPTGALNASQRIDASIAPGGIQICGKAGNCQAVCPKHIPLMNSWGRIGRAATIHVIKKFFDG
jgi:succinate dehydrogenase / fumarate reductase iron-sulfur subunit